MASVGLHGRVFLSLGANLGDRRVYLRDALVSLNGRGMRIVACSSVYETEPVGVKEQPDFLNLVCEVRTRLSPEELLAKCMQVEAGLGRVRSRANGPRTIDIDILFYGSEVIETSELAIPHPRLYSRNFVLVPLAEIALDFPDPRSGLTVSELLSRSPDRSRVAVAEGVKVW
jgi:2-amino-4-hydroxy-6-hydroxymethyldihydropteridine diphosphokinase